MSDVYSMKGRIHKIFETSQITDKFRKREFVLTTTNPTNRGTYVEYIKFQTVQNRCEFLDDMEKGDVCIVKFAVMGRKVGKAPEDKYFTNLDVLEIKTVGHSDSIDDVSAQSIGDELPMNGDMPAALMEDLEKDLFANKGKEEEDDLPF